MISTLENVTPTAVNRYPFVKCKDSRGHEITGLWQRNGRFYCQMEVTGKGTRRIPLLDDSNQPVKSVPEAIKAKSKLLADRDLGRAPGPRITPQFSTYYAHYISWLESTEAKSPLTIKVERCALKRQAEFYGETRLNQIIRKDLKDYARERIEVDEVSNRAVNVDIIALSNMLKFAQDEGWLKGELVTENWTQLKYVAPKRRLVSLEDVEKLCAESTVKVDDQPKHRNGQFLSDYVKLLAFSGARRQAGLSAQWNQVDWDNRQISLHTKFDKTVVVDFNEKLEAHLKDMWSRRDTDSKWIFPAVRSGKKDVGYFSNPQKVFNIVTKAAGLPDLHLHDLRHFFISFCVMSGVDTLTVARWVGHEDGGVLIGKIYGHLNPEHARLSASKVQFTPKQTTVPPSPAETQGPSEAKLPNVEFDLTAEQLLDMLQRKLAGAKPNPAPVA